MIGIVVVTHGRIGEELCATAEHILGVQKQLASVAVFGADPPHLKQLEVSKAVEAVRDPDVDDGVLILTDLVGCTPSNVVSLGERTGREVVITGVNLPMVMAIASARKRGSLDAVADIGITAGRKHIAVSPALAKPVEA